MATTKKVKTFRVRCWIDVNGEKFFGPGRAELLRQIDDTGSIAQAAKSMGMSYKKAWAMVDEMNAKATHPYVVAQKGGQSGGGTHLTPEGRAIVNAYQKMMDRLQTVIEKEQRVLDLI
jgi:molybdate transport system regulatory protein